MASLLLMNTSFLNKGDALMNEAIRRALGEDHDWSVMASLAVLNPRETRGYAKYLGSDRPEGTRKEIVFSRAMRAATAGMSLVPGAVRRATPLRTARDIDVAIDVSGYCFGDHWGQARVDMHARIYERLKREGARVVLMSKTWGPFETISSESLNRMMDHVDLAFARDRRSEQAIRARLSDASNAKLHFAPDYTHGVSVEPLAPVGTDRVAYLVPSRRVIDSGTLSEQAYYRLFGDARSQMAEAGLTPRLLIHETSNDLSFIRDAEQMGFAPEDIVVADDAIHAKRLIAGAKLVVSSRLHGLYNALNSAVPVIVVAWSYKYVEALKQYGCEDCLVDLTDPAGSMRGLIDRLATDPVERARVEQAMREGKRVSAEHSADMWQRIRALL